MTRPAPTRVRRRATRSTLSRGVSGQVTIDLCNSAYDTKVYVYEGSCPGTLVACNDDACNDPSGNPFRSIVSCVNLSASSTYYVVVDGYFGDCGSYNITTSFSTGCPAPCDPENCPPGALLEGEPVCGTNYVDAYNGGCNSIPNVFSNIPCDVTVCGAGGNYSFNGLSYRDTDWYAFNLPVAGQVTATMCASFDSQLAAYRRQHRLRLHHADLRFGLRNRWHERVLHVVCCCWRELDLRCDQRVLGCALRFALPPHGRLWRHHCLRDHELGRYQGSLPLVQASKSSKDGRRFSAPVLFLSLGREISPAGVVRCVLTHSAHSAIATAALPGDQSKPLATTRRPAIDDPGKRDLAPSLGR